MEHRERAEQFWQGLLAEAAKAGIQWAELSEALKHHRSYLSTLRRRSNDPNLDDAFGVLAALPEPEWCVMSRLFPPPAGAPLLRSLRERALAAEAGWPVAGAPARVLPGLAEAWGKILSLPVAAAAEPGPSFRAKLDWLDEAPGERAAEAARGLEEICLEMQLYSASRKAVHPQALGEMGVALALWAALQAGAGSLEALEAQALGLELAERSNDPWSLGICHWRAGLLLQARGLGHLALGFLQAAGFHFGMSGDTRCAARLLGSTAEVLLELGRPAESEAMLQRQLRWLPPGANRHRFAALAKLAELAQAAGRTQEALECVEAAELQGRRDGVALAMLAARKAALLFELGEPQRGANALGAALEGLAQQGLAAELVLVLAEAVQYHEGAGQPAVVKLLAEQAGACLSKLKAGRLRCLVEDFVALRNLPAGIPPGFLSREQARLARAGVSTVSAFGPGGAEAALARRGPREAEEPKRRRRRRRDRHEAGKTSAISDDFANPRGAAANR